MARAEVIKWRLELCLYNIQLVHNRTLLHCSAYTGDVGHARSVPVQQKYRYRGDRRPGTDREGGGASLSCVYEVDCVHAEELTVVLANW